MPLSRALSVLLASAAALAACSSDTGPAEAAPGGGQRATAVFAGGCFWCTEFDFDKMPGVLATVSGYIGGRTPNPTYEQVSAGNTGHIEAVRVTYDPARTSYAELATRFMRTVDPLDAGGSFCDRGYQYRSAFFVADAQQKRVAEAVKARAARTLSKPIATLVLPASRFTPAEDYHQDYYQKNPIRYRFYRSRCGRDARLAEVWGGK
nr:peptide-methionine (S)-S-oxide reductase MsrA [uncultured Sphingomonas sp.]